MEEQASNFRMIAKTVTGLEEILAEELTDLGATSVKKLNRGAEFYGDNRILYKANYLCRTALRILKPIRVFQALSEDELYKQIIEIDWPHYLDLNGTFSVDGVTTYSNITHSKYLALKTKDAIADHFRQKFGKRPNVNLDNPDLTVNVRIFKNECTVSIDSSGDSLHKRGYRKTTGPAPMNEVLAAGLVRLSGWDGQKNFIDPMCGSGTIPIEAALYAGNIPPGSFREDYTFKHWQDFDPDLWEEIKQEAKDKIRRIEGMIIGSDWSGRVLVSARENVESAGLNHAITLKTDFFEDMKPPEGGGVLIMNPPYGERIKINNIIALYKGIGNTLKQKYQGYGAWIISSHMQALKFVGLRPSRNIIVFNGPLECRFAKFEVYEGSKKDLYKQQVADEKQTSDPKFQLKTGENQTTVVNEKIKERESQKISGKEESADQAPKRIKRKRI